MPRPMPRLLRAMTVLAACGSLSACVAATGQPYGVSYYSAQVYTAPAYRGGYYGPGSGTGFGGLYTAPAYRGHYGPGYGSYFAPRYYGPGSGSGYGRYYAPYRGYYGPGSGTGLGRFWR